MKDLAIVIPAYKVGYLDQALNSLARQTKKGFNVYIGDDASPDNLKEVVDRFSSILNISYHRFESNIGSKNLVNQWKRCIDLSKDEKWIWLFSDDDIAGDNCVELFFEKVSADAGRFDVYRFNTCMINASGAIMHEPLLGPDEESSAEMAYNLLLGKRGNSMPDHIFSRKVYDASGGIVFTKYAQSADWATSILFSREKGMCVIQDAKVFWRQSGMNVSSVSRSHRSEMIQGYLCFLSWLKNHFEYLDRKKDSNITRQMIKNASWENFKNLIQNHYKGFDIKDTSMLIKFLHDHFSMPFAKAFMELYRIKVVLFHQNVRKYVSFIKSSLFSSKKSLIST